MHTHHVTTSHAVAVDEHADGLDAEDEDGGEVDHEHVFLPDGATALECAYPPPSLVSYSTSSPGRVAAPTTHHSPLTNEVQLPWWSLNEPPPR